MFEHFDDSRRYRIAVNDWLGAQVRLSTKLRLVVNLSKMKKRIFVAWHFFLENFEKFTCVILFVVFIFFLFFFLFLLISAQVQSGTQSEQGRLIGHVMYGKYPKGSAKHTNKKHQFRSINLYNWAFRNKIVAIVCNFF